MKKKILVIEDDFDLLWMINKLLALNDYEVLTAVTGSEGFKAFLKNAEQISAVILDLTLPDLEGEEIMKKIFEKYPLKPIIITTGLEDSSQRSRLKKAGVKACLVKPFDLELLVNLVSDIV